MGRSPASSNASTPDAKKKTLKSLGQVKKTSNPSLNNALKLRASAAEELVDNLLRDDEFAPDLLAEFRRLTKDKLSFGGGDLQCIVLYCIVLLCILLYCNVLYCMLLYCIALFSIVVYCIVVLCIV
jgi:hypothetical protein